jgi:pimeloyl-ACP methyl ester carboxylesterase
MRLRGMTVLASMVALGWGLAAPAVADDGQFVAVPPAKSGLKAPDYSDPEAWAAYPGRKSHADDRPDGVGSGKLTDVDVFFIHPTTDLSLVAGNAPYDGGGEVRRRLDDIVLKVQASVFNDCCRIYAPRYRQASLGAITHDGQADFAADDLAYGDVAHAFDAFLREVGGHRFIIAGHSQGSIHALRLLQERIIGTPLQQRLVVAYIPGVSLPVEIERLGLPLCASASAQGCVVAWNTVRDSYRDERRLDDAVIWWQGRYQKIAGRPIACVNPLNWQINGTAPASANRGGVYSAGDNAAIPAPVPAVTGASCQDGLLGVDVALGERRHFSDLLTILGVYHDFDYGLFYMNIRENAALKARN